MSCRNAPRATDPRVDAELGGHHPGDVRGLDQVAEHVLAVGRAVLEPADQGDQLRVQVGDPDVEQRVLGGPLAERIDLVAGALVGLLDAVRVDPAVLDQHLQGDPADLAPDRVEAGQQHGFRGVVDDHVDAGDGLERADVAALAADDPALDLVGRQVHDRDHRLRGLVARPPAGSPRRRSPWPAAWRWSRPRTRSRRIMIAESRRTASSWPASSSARAASTVSPEIRTSSACCDHAAA